MIYLVITPRLISMMIKDNPCFSKHSVLHSSRENLEHTIQNNVKIIAGIPCNARQLIKAFKLLHTLLQLKLNLSGFHFASILQKYKGNYGNIHFLTILGIN